MPMSASGLVVPSATVLTQLGLRATYFLVFRTGRIWSSMATSASVMFLRRLLSPLTSATVDRAVWYG